jgi:flagellin
MANIGATTAFYKVETSLTRANSEVSKSMERLATGKQNANAGDRSSYVAMADTFRLDYVATKAGIKGASVAMGYLETGMRTLDAASALLSRLQELAVLGANRTNTVADHTAINAEAEALADEFHRLLDKATYKGKDLFVTSAGSEYVALGGRAANMSFGIEKITYTDLYDSTSGGGAGVTVSDANGPSHNVAKNLKVLPSHAVLDSTTLNAGTVADTLKSGKTYEIVSGADTSVSADNTKIKTDTTISADSEIAVGTVFTVTTSSGGLRALTGTRMVVREIDTGALTTIVEAVQKNVNTARVQAGSQYAALESAVTYTTDLTAQYELGFNTVNDVNFSMETAHLAKNQILQQAATAMLAQANSGQQGLLQLIQG